MKKLNEFISFLKTMVPVPALTFNENLCISKLNGIRSENWANKDEFSKLVKEKKKFLKNNNLNFFFDIGYKNAETSAMLQLVDDNKLFKGKRREYLLDENAKEIGIANKLEGRKNCAYLLTLFEK